MWVFLNNAMFSAVVDKDYPDRMAIRARVKGDLEKVFPGLEVHHSPGGDYLYRVYTTREDLAETMYAASMNIDYTNFKDSIPKHDEDRHDAYNEVWGTMFQYQKKLDPVSGWHGGVSWHDYYAYQGYKNVGDTDQHLDHEDYKEEDEDREMSQLENEDWDAYVERTKDLGDTRYSKFDFYK